MKGEDNGSQPRAIPIPKPSDHLFLTECLAIVERAHLTKRQAEVLSLRLEGYTFEQIGQHRGHTKQGAQRIFMQALKKIRRSVHVYRYRGLGEVYRFEVLRGGFWKTFGRMSSRG